MYDRRHSRSLSLTHLSSLVMFMLYDEDGNGVLDKQVRAKDHEAAAVSLVVLISRRRIASSVK